MPRTSTARHPATPRCALRGRRRPRTVAAPSPAIRRPPARAARHARPAGATTCAITGLTNGDSYSLHGHRDECRRHGSRRRTPSLATPANRSGRAGPQQRDASETARSRCRGRRPHPTAAARITGLRRNGKPRAERPARQRATTHMHDQRTEQRNQLHLHGHGRERRWSGPGIESALGNTAAPASPPGAPTLTTATPGNGQVSLGWTAPGSTGGSAITGYTATASPGGATCTTSGALRCTVSGLTNGTCLHLHRQRPPTAAGTGPASNALAATPRTVPGAPNLTAPPGERPGRAGLDGAGLERREPDHRLHRHGESRAARRAAPRGRRPVPSQV